MAEGSRSGISAANPEYSPESTRRPGQTSEVPLPGMPTGRNLLPARSATSDRWNRSGENIGWRLGCAVSGVRSIPNRFGRARSRLHIVSDRTRQNASAAAFEMMDSAAQRAGNWRDSAEQWLHRAADRADSNWSRLTHETRHRLQHLRETTVSTTQRARNQAQQQLETAARRLRHWEQEDPVKVLATIGGIAFVAGAAIRVWRSSRD